jgi:transglutaminase-like putative cysteine protease
MSNINDRTLRQTARREVPVRRLDRRTGVLALALLAPAACIAPPFVTAGFAQAPPVEQSQETASYTTASDTTVRLNADRTAEIVETTRTRVLSVAAVEEVAEQNFHYTEGMESFEIMEAYTGKADGTKTPVDRGNIVTRDGASGLKAAFEPKAKAVTVIFPDVAVGDTLVVTYRDRVDRDTFAGHFEYKAWFSRNAARTGSTMRVIAPSDLPLKVGVQGEGVQHTVTVAGNETQHLITARAAPSEPAEEHMTARTDRDPGVYITTLAGYEDLARNYWGAVRGAIEVTPEISRLAGEITQGIDDRRAQARAISAWIKTNIQYVSVPLGNTRVDAHDAGTVLKNRYGDCKDVAVLASALLAARGIAAEHVLINSGSAYTLPEPATMAHLNDVIIYLPEFGIYDDPGSSFSSFGVLDEDAYDKPVVRVSDGGAHLARTPAMKPEDSVSIRRTRVSIAADGTVSGESEETATGFRAAVMRQVGAAIQNHGLEESAAAFLRSAETPGTGTFEVGAPANLGDSYSMRARFTYDERVSIKPSADLAIPFGLGVLSRPGESALGSPLPVRKTPFVCIATTQVEEIELTFAEGLPLPEKIEGRRIETKSFVYTADYKLDGRTLKVRREFVSRVPGQVCTPEVAAEIAQPLRDVSDSNDTHMTFADVK